MAKTKKPSVKVKDMKAKKNPAGGALGIKHDAATIKLGTSALKSDLKINTLDTSALKLK